MNADDPATSLPQNYWVDFERLAVDFLSSQLSISPDLVYVSGIGYTSNSNALHRLTNKKGHGKQLTLLEAKLRAREESNPRSFLATLVIAFNVSAQTLIVVSNKPFVREVLEQAALFHWRTGIQILLIDGATLAHWIRCNLHRIAGSYSKLFIKFLLRGYKSQREYQKVQIDRVSLPGDGNFGTSVPLSATIELGWKTDTEIAPCRLNLFKNPATTGDPSLDLVGSARKLTARKLREALNTSPGILVVKGPPGVGKTTIVHHCLQSTTRPAAILDFNLISTDRQLFVKTLGALTGVDLIAAIGPDSTEQAINGLLEGTEATSFSDEIRSAVVTVLSESRSLFAARSDLNSRLLLDFLELAVAPNSHRQRPIIVYENLNRASAESLGFLVPLAQALMKAGVTVIVELRDGSDAPALTALEWETFVTIFQRIATLGTFLIEPLSQQDAEAFLAELLPGLGSMRWQIIRERVGCIPLFLRSAAAWLRSQNVLRGSGDALLLEDLRTFFEGINPGDCISLLDRLILAAKERSDLPLAECISAASLLGGRLTRRTLALLCPEMDLNRIAEALCETSLFSNDTGHPLELRVAHDLLLDRIRFIDERRPFRRASVAQTLLARLDDVTDDVSSRDARRVDLLVAMGEWAEVCPRALEVAESRAKARQWAESSYYFATAHRATNYLAKPNERQLFAIRSLVRLLEVEQERYRIGLEENLHRLDELKALLRLSPYAAGLPDLNELSLRILLLEWRSKFVREKFKAALKTIRKARTMALRSSTSADTELRGAALASFGINLKAVERREESIRAFEEFRRAVPDSLILRSEQLSNLASPLLQADPKQALELYLEILGSIDGKSYPILRAIHVHVDIAMSYFLMRQYARAREAARYALALAEANGVPAQEARCRNILGCCHWSAEKLEDADRQFDCAGLASERTLSLRFLWRFRTNRAGTALELGKYDTALEHARSAEDLILIPRARMLPTFFQTPSHQRPRWYTALLAIGRCYSALRANKDYKRLLVRVGSPDFESQVDFITRSEMIASFDLDPTAFHSNRIMITG